MKSSPSFPIIVGHLNDWSLDCIIHIGKILRSFAWWKGGGVRSSFQVLFLMASLSSWLYSTRFLLHLHLLYRSAPCIYQPPNIIFASTFFPFTSVCFKTSRLHGFYNLSIFYLPPHFYHLLPCVFKTSRPSPTSAPWIFQPPNFLFASTILPFTSVCFQDFPYISDFDPIDLPTSPFPICLNIFTIYSRVFSRVPAYLQCSPRTLRTFTWWLSLVLPGFYVFASLHFDSLFLY